MRILGWPGLEKHGPNPYTRLLYSAIRKIGMRVDSFSVRNAVMNRYDIVHVHWPEYYLMRPNVFKRIIGTFGQMACIWWQRWRGAKIVWTVHNLQAHGRQRPRTEKLFFDIFTRSLDGITAFTEAGRQRAFEKWPTLKSIPSSVIPHGHYRSEFPNVIDAIDARNKLSIKSNNKVLLFFGVVARYKNVPQLIDVFHEAFQSDDTNLLIAGQAPLQSEADDVRRRAGGDSRIHLDLRPILDPEVPVLFASADLVVLPFTNIENSGSAMLALSLGKPILVPSLGAIKELQQEVGQKWVYTYECDLTASILKRALEWALEPRFGVPDLTAFNWDLIAKQSCSAFQEIAGSIPPVCDEKQFSDVHG
jgi:beta-1,4-mannosyltransferase